MTIQIIIGPPGTGKTTTILDAVDSLISSGVSPTEIAFVSFTKSAIRTAVDRAADRFHLDPDADFPYWRTIHSMALGTLGAQSRSEVVAPKHWAQFGESFRYRFSVELVADEGIPLFTIDKNEADHLRAMYTLARLCRCSTREAMLKVRNRPPHLTAEHVSLFANRWEAFKKEYALIDFTDMLERALRRGGRPPVHFAFVDEAQDCCRLQTELLEKWFFSGPDTTIVGDDDQAIFTWAGADPQWVIDLSKRFPTRVLDQSYRVPRVAHPLAMSIIASIRDRIAKAYKPREAAGEIVRSSDIAEAIALIDGGTGVVLARNTFLLEQAFEALVSRAEPFSTRAGPKSPFERETTRRAFRALSNLRRGGSADAKDVAALLDLVPVMKDDLRLLPHGLKAAIKRSEFPVTLARLYELKAKDFADRIRRDDPFDVAIRLADEERRYWNRLLDRFPSGVLPESRIELSSVHRYKGEEADTVVLVPDLAHATYSEFAQTNGAAEHRVAYVAATRARERLVLMSPARPRMHYPYADHLANGARPR